ncbi:HipA protein [Bifidobacterium dolichotidis]|uniref:HipA protein n=1 Tax=Bifidobacterium dolichotidis TaxID=2306976 RepID=A0A430FTI2_9BIFI|nr:type II toxin-antitoxin system HipA family toxin [Bifidobacterium dolichotidis]RSX56203.1 HipA protein [Bifidobacterium dolichotidis]
MCDEAFDIWADDQRRVGSLHLIRSSSKPATLFQYDSDYLHDPHAYALSPDFPLRSQLYHCQGIPSFLQDQLPDYWERSLQSQQWNSNSGAAPLHGNPSQGACLPSDQYLSHEPTNDWDLLSQGIDIARQGNLRLAVQGNSTFLNTKEIPQQSQLSTLFDAVWSVSKNEATTTQVCQLIQAGGSSLGGSRPKVVVRNGAKILIAKFPQPYDQYDVVAWEKTALDVAAIAGIPVPQSQLLTIDHHHVLLLERFDRVNSQLNGPRIPYLSAHTLLHSPDLSLVDWADLADFMLSFVAHWGEDKEQLFARICFNLLINNTDDHMRNIGFLRYPSGWALAPAFDLNPEFTQAPFDTNLLGTNTGDRSNALLEFARYLGIDKQRTAAIVHRNIEAVRQIDDIAQQYGIPAKQRRVIIDIINERIALLSQIFGEVSP